MAETKRRTKLKYILAITWLLFTISFALWWMYVGLNQLNQLSAFVPDANEIFRHRRMMIWEGASWIILLFVGGSTLIAYVAKEARRNRELKEFFASFSHDIKTSLASLRLQAESLKEDMASQSNPVMDRLVKDTVRLDLQLQNSLFMSSYEDMKLFTESLSFNNLVKKVGIHWPQLKIVVERDFVLRGDERAFLSLLSNLFQNSVVHGQASEIQFYAQRDGAKRIRVEFKDNGKGFEGQIESLGQLFRRPTSESGSSV